MHSRNFSLREWKRRRWWKNYCWVTTQSAERSCCGLSGSSVLEFGCKVDRHLLIMYSWPYMYPVPICTVRKVISALVGVSVERRWWVKEWVRVTGGMILKGGHGGTDMKTCPTATSHTRNPGWIGLVSNPNLRIDASNWRPELCQDFFILIVTDN
jgi:hypothetical protein